MNEVKTHWLLTNTMKLKALSCSFLYHMHMHIIQLFYYGMVRYTIHECHSVLGIHRRHTVQYSTIQHCTVYQWLPIVIIIIIRMEDSSVTQYNGVEYNGVRYCSVTTSSSAVDLVTENYSTLQYSTYIDFCWYALLNRSHSYSYSYLCLYRHLYSIFHIQRHIHRIRNISYQYTPLYILHRIQNSLQCTVRGVE
jgi:hypothetical protein